MTVLEMIWMMESKIREFKERLKREHSELASDILTELEKSFLIGFQSGRDSFREKVDTIIDDFLATLPNGFKRSYLNSAKVHLLRNLRETIDRELEK